VSDAPVLGRAASPETAGTAAWSLLNQVKLFVVTVGPSPLVVLRAVGGVTPVRKRYVFVSEMDMSIAGRLVGFDLMLHIKYLNTIERLYDEQMFYEHSF